jgi:nucleolin
MPKNKKVESSSSSDDSSSEDVKPQKTQPPKKGAPVAKKEENKKPSKKQESADDSDSSSEDKKPVAKKLAPAKKEEPKKNAKKKESSSDDSSSESAPKKPSKAGDKKKVAKKEESSGSGSDGDSDSEEAVKPAKNDKKRKADSDDADEDSPKPATKKAKTESGAVATATEQSNGENTRLFLGNLSFKIDDDAIRAFFKDVGELTDIHWVTDKQTGKFYGTGFVAFATAAEAKAAAAKNGEDVLGRPIKIDFAQSRGERTPRDGGDRGQQRTPRDGGQREQRPATPKPDGCTTVFLGNLSFQIDENAVRSHFADCGEISSIRWVERDGQFKGCGFVEFSNSNSTDKAVALNGSDLMGRPVRVDFSAPKPPRQ